MSTISEFRKITNNKRDIQTIRTLGPFWESIDIGACIGDFTKELAKITTHRVYAFEPSPSNFKILRENTKDLSNVNIYKIAVSNQNRDDGILYKCPTNLGMNRMYKSDWCKGGKAVYNVKVRPLDSMIIHYTGSIDFVKIDVEGFEHRVIMGMKQLLKWFHPFLMIEWHPPTMEEALSSPKALYDFLHYRLNYNMMTNCKNNQPIKSYEELDSLTRERAGMNILFY